jgi:hypothetical protein
MERAVSDTLDEYLARLQGILATSWAHPIEFIDWLEKRGYTIKRIVDEEPVSLTQEEFDEIYDDTYFDAIEKR